MRSMSDDEREEYRREEKMERFERQYGFVPGVDECPNCGEKALSPLSYVYGDNLDGRLGVTRTGYECQVCGIEVLR